MQILSREKQGAAVYGSFLATLGVCALISNSLENQKLNSAPRMDSSSLLSKSSQLKAGFDYVELRGQFNFIGKAPQKTSTQYISSTGAPAIATTRNVYLYNCLDQSGATFLVASQKELPNDLEFVKGRVHESKRYLADSALAASSTDFMQVDFFKSRSADGLQGSRIWFNTAP